jgi:nitrogen regulatory protein P-II 1
MKYCKITAIIQPSRIAQVEQTLKELYVPGISITKVQGYGESPNFFNQDWTSANARIEIFVEAGKAEEIAQGIIESAYTGKEGDGIVAILPVESLYRIRTKQQLEID